MDQYIGEIRMFAGNYPPEGWAFCNGQILPILQNQALFALIGTTYGGDGQNNFALPDLRGRVPVGQGRNPITGTTFPMGQKNGTETVTLALNHLPSHTHTVSATSEAGTLTSPNNAVWAKNVMQYTSQPSANMNVGAIAMTGGGAPHTNIMPFLTISFIIALTGYFPPRT